MGALSLLVSRGVPGLSSPLVLALDFSETPLFHFGGHKGIEETYIVLVESPLDCSGIR